MGDNWWDYEGVNWQPAEMLVETPITTGGATEGPAGVSASTIISSAPSVSDAWGSAVYGSSTSSDLSGSSNNWLSSLLSTVSQVLAGKKQVSYSAGRGVQVTPAATQLSPNTALIVGGAILVAFVLLMKS